MEKGARGERDEASNPQHRSRATVSPVDVRKMLLRAFVGRTNMFIQDIS